MACLPAVLTTLVFLLLRDDACWVLHRLLTLTMGTLAFEALLDLWVPPEISQFSLPFKPGQVRRSQVDSLILALPGSSWLCFFHLKGPAQVRQHRIVALHLCHGFALCKGSLFDPCHDSGFNAWTRVGGHFSGLFTSSLFTVTSDLADSVLRSLSCLAVFASLS